MTNFKFKNQNDFQAKLVGVNWIFANTFLIDPYITAPQKLDQFK